MSTTTEPATTWRDRLQAVYCWADEHPLSLFLISAAVMLAATVALLALMGVPAPVQCMVVG